MLVAASLLRSRAVGSGCQVAAIAVALIGTAPALLAQVVARVSVDSSGVEGNAASDTPVISSDGRFVAFLSTATNLTSDTARILEPQVFLHDRATGTTECISVSTSGAVGNRSCYTPAITSDGRYVAFATDATNLVPAGGTGFFEIYLRDRVTHKTERVSLPSTGNPQDGDSFFPAISADGLIVAFESSSSNLVDNDTNRTWDVFVRDRSMSRTELVSLSSFGQPGDSDSRDPSISDDGTLVAFDSESNNLVANDRNGYQDVFVRDRSAGTTGRVSVDSSGGEGDYYSSLPSISADGSCVAFESWSDNLVANDTNRETDVFVHERTSGVTERVSVDAAGGELHYDRSEYASISGDGSLVSFTSWANNVTPSDTNGVADVFIRDRNAATTTVVTVDCAWAAANGESILHALSSDGTCIAFSSAATDLIDGDTNRCLDVFVNDLSAPPFAASWNNYGAGFPGTLGVPTLTAGADPVFGTTLTLDAGNSSGTWSDGLLLIGLQSASIPTSAGGTLLVDPVMELLFVLKPAGTSLSEYVPLDAELCGLSLYLQVLELDRGAAKGISFTPGLQLTVGH
jgi:Tol biopolymer transport system component